jgi:hypothetical protein
MIEIKSVAQLAKSLSVKREKDAADDTVVVCHLKFADLFVEREVVDELCKQPIGWHQAFYDDLGAPVGALELSLPGRAWSVTGKIKAGPNRPAQLSLLDASLSKVALELTKLGALVSGAVSWTARGDEVEDLTELLGGLVAVEWRLTDGGQQDMLRDGVQAAADSIRKLAQQDGIESVELQVGGRTIAKFGKDQPRAGACS